jgi:hypothetical protein
VPLGEPKGVDVADADAELMALAPTNAPTTTEAVSQRRALTRAVVSRRFRLAVVHGYSMTDSSTSMFPRVAFEYGQT